MIQDRRVESTPIRIIYTNLQYEFAAGDGPAAGAGDGDGEGRFGGGGAGDAEAAEGGVEGETGERGGGGWGDEKGEGLLDVVEAEFASGGANGVEGGAEEAAAEGRGGFLERLAPGDEGSVGGGLKIAWEEACGEARPIAFVFMGECGEAGEGGFDFGVVVAGEGGEELVAGAGSCAGSVEVGGVFAPGEAFGGEPGAKDGARDFDEGADETFAGDGEDAGEAAGACASEDPEEEGFSLIGPGVAEGDAGEVVGGAGVVEESAAEVAGVGFEVALGGGGVGASDFEGHTNGDAEGADKLFVAVGFFGAEEVVEVEGVEGVAEAVEDVEKGYGVASAGEGHADARLGEAGRGQHAIT